MQETDSCRGVQAQAGVINKGPSQMTGLLGIMFKREIMSR